MKPLLYVARMEAFLNVWFTAHDEARAYRESSGGYLLPHQDHFFVTVPEAIREPGLDPNDPDGERIGWDWVRPLDREARERLETRRLVAM